MSLERLASRYGFTTHSPTNTANTLLAGAIHKALLTHIETPDRGVKRARFVVLREATCPATLVEVGFLSHPAELKQLRPDYRKHSH